MTITAKIEHGNVVFPSGVRLPDGTMVQITVLSSPMAGMPQPDSVALPVFRGDGLQPGIDLADARALREKLDDPVAPFTMP